MTTQAERATITALLHDGLSDQAIADQTGAALHTIRRYKKLAGLTKPKPRLNLTDELTNRVQAMIADGASITEIARTTGISRKSIARKFKYRGWTKREAALFGHEIRQLQAG